MVSLAFLILSLSSVAFSCAPPLRRDTTPSNSTASFPFFEPGVDAPADSATIGYFSNHLALNTNNLTRSVDFYTRIFGMRHVFTYHLTQHLSVTYLGHSQGGRNGSGYQTAAEMLRHKQNSAGLLELVYFNTTGIGGGEPIPGPDKRASTLSHIGIIVPDTTATQARLESYNVTIYKKVAAPMPSDGPLNSPFTLGDASNLSAEAFKEIQDQMSALNMLNIFAADPDGNLLEILPMDEGDLFG